MNRKTLAGAMLVGAFALMPIVAAFAEAFPEKPLTMVVPFGPGGSTDIISRPLARAMHEHLGRPVVVVNRPGAGGNLGAESVARAAPDGYTLLLGTTALSIAPAVYANLRYDVLTDLAPVSQITVSPNVLAVHPSVSIRSLKELLALAKAKPGELTASFGGIGTANHLGLALLNSMAGVEIRPVPYNNNSQAVLDVVSGYVAMTLVPAAVVVPLVQSGRLRALGVTTAKRSDTLPDVPTISEAGVPGFEASSWTGLLTTGGTAASVVARIHNAAAAGMKTPHVQDALRNVGAMPIASSPDAFARALREDIGKYRKVARAAGIQPQ